MPHDSEQAFERALDHHRAGRLGDAERGYRQILEHEPQHPDALHLLGVIALQTGHLDAALALVQQAVDLRPDGAVYWNNLGQVHERMGRNDQAERAYEAAIGLDPRYAEACNNLGHILERRGDVAGAEARYREAIRLDPQYAEPHTNLGNLQKDRGDLDEAIASYRRAIALRPDVSFLHSNLLLTLHYHPAYSPADLAREHRDWAARHVAPVRPDPRPHPNEPDAERRLRIGYVSPDFREHPVARFVLPLFQHHDRNRVEVFAYSDVRRPDGVSERVRACVDQWRDSAALSDEQLVAAIREDRIDILVDLAAHSGHNRLLAFARRPAPVQVTYLAYCSTTGVDAIDYRLTDRFLDPSDDDQAHYAERSIRLPDCYWCYSIPPLDDPPPSGRLPGPPTFGCLNNFAKVSDATLSLWTRLLQSVPDARLLIYARAERHRDRVLSALRRADVDEARATFVGRQPLKDYLATYRLIDVALDPFPFVGGTTTFDALWMGVPVVSLAGSTAVSRGGSTILSNLGLEHLVARSEPQYAAIAARLIRDRSALATFRQTLRDRLEGSALMDAPRFARSLEGAFREIWRAWCYGE
jgi:protein O-GlcNAc transferase